MKILILTDKFPPEKTTVGNIVLRTAKDFSQKGFSVYVVATTRERDEEGESELEGIKIFRLYSDYPERWRAYLSLYNYQTVKKFKKIFNQIKPDVVHAHNIHYYLSYHCLKIAKKGKARVFLTAHDVMLFHYGKLIEFINPNIVSCSKEFNYRVSPWQQIKRFKKRYNPFRNLVIRYYLKYVDKIFSVSQALKEALTQNGIKNVEVIHNGIDVNLWKTDDRTVSLFKEKNNLNGKKVILFGGRLSEAKGGHQAVLALKELVAKMPEVVMLVVGTKNVYADKMLEFAKDIGIGEDLIFTGWISGGELVAAYCASDLVIVPSVCFDSFPTVILEAMACRRPVVATCFGGAREMVIDGESGYIVNPFSLESLTDRTSYLLTNPVRAGEFGEVGHNFLTERFDLNKSVDKLLKWY